MSQECSRPAPCRPSLSRTTTRRGMEMWTSPRRRRARTSATTSWRLSEPSARRALLWCRDSAPCASCCSTRPCCHPATRARARGTCSRLGARLRTRTRSSSNIASCDNRRPTYVFVVTRTSFVGIGFSAGRGVLLCSCLGGRCALVVRHVGFYQVFLRVPDGVQEHLLLRSRLHDADSGRSVGVAEGLPPVARAAGHGPRSGGRARQRARRGQLRLERVLRCFATT